ncbi:MAG: pyruvate formate lyase-activating protein [Lachnospiraceae bacterium]|nr:pyruvate formate lyase-activating protein [Lachnospiraceae bacterium]
MVIGRIHSIETFGAVDGPGVRFVVFFQGCPMRCAYCHNPDTWDPGRGTEMSVDEIYAKFERNREFYEKGGITASGGEPMMQIEFLTALFERFHSEGVHTCLDTSGIMYKFGKHGSDLSTDKQDEYKLSRLMAVTDLVMLDIKRFDREGHKDLTGHYNDGILEFAKYLSDIGKKMWIRFVCVPGVTDDEEELKKYGEFLSTLKTVEALDVLPYHTMGVKKYDALGIPYRLEGLKDASPSYVSARKQIILDALKETRQSQNPK